VPAVSVSDITILPRVQELPGAKARAVRSITTAPQGFEGLEVLQQLLKVLKAKAFLFVVHLQVLI